MLNHNLNQQKNVIDAFQNTYFLLLLQPDREDELMRIEGQGGKVINWNGARVFGVLAMSRAIGIFILSTYLCVYILLKTIWNSSFVHFYTSPLPILQDFSSPLELGTQYFQISRSGKILMYATLPLIFIKWLFSRFSNPIPSG